MTSVLALALALAQNKVTFTYTSYLHFNKVSVAGSFNNWNKEANPLVAGADGKTWTATLDLAPGKHYYKFVLDGENWITDPKAVKNEDDGNGNTNSVMFVLPPGYDKPAVKGDGTVTFQALRHMQEIPYLNWDRGQLTLTVNARTNDVAEVDLYFNDKPTGPPQKVRMSPAGGDEFDTRYVAHVPWSKRGLFRYWFSFDDKGRGPWTLDRSGAWTMKEGSSDDSFKINGAQFHPVEPPNWISDAVIYQIFPDRFANGDTSNDPSDVVPWNGKPTYANFFGGDVAGVRQKLPYLKSLGVNCVYFNPVFEGPSNHRYEATDYKKIDHRFGSNQEFSALTREMSRQGIKTVLDGVFNHTAVDFFAFDDIIKNQSKSKFLNWYTIKSFPVEVREQPPYEAWFGFKSMPKLNNSNPEVRDYLLSVPDFWNQTADIAGWRLDVANEIPSSYWQAFRKRVKSHGQDKWIVGEFWGDASPWLKGDQWDSVMNYQFRNSVLSFVAQGKTTPTQYWSSLMRTYDAYGPQVSRNMMNLLGSHDTSRILNECSHDARLARLAAMLQFTWVGAPSVYYGDELGMEGDRDPDNRRPMQWQMVTESNPFSVLYKSLIDVRKDVTALRQGDPLLIKADDSMRTLVFQRKFGKNWAIVAVNRSDAPVEIKVPVTGSANVVSWTNDADKVTVDRHQRRIGSQTKISVQPLSVTIVSPTSAVIASRAKAPTTSRH